MDRRTPCRNYLIVCRCNHAVDDLMTACVVFLVQDDRRRGKERDRDKERDRNRDFEKDSPRQDKKQQSKKKRQSGSPVSNVFYIV